MIDLHPSMSGLPLAAALLLITSEAMYCVPRLRPSRSIVQTTAVIACVVTVVSAFISGYQASSLAGELTGAVETAMANHHSLGRLLLINSLLLATFFFLSRVAVHGKRAVSLLYYLSFIVHIIVTVWVGYLGGRLVFEHGVNVLKVQ
jgi:uncharacterized membrane protein